MSDQFTFDGRDVPVHDGDTYASALHRAGHRALSRSFKYHRPRGIYCNSGGCAGCFVAIDGVPSVPACMTAARAGARVASQNTIGGAKRDVLAVVDKVYRRGFDPHAAFTKPRLLNAAFLHSVRFMSGSGTAPAPGSEPPAVAAKHQEIRVDELIIGAGAHGVARAASRAGKRGRVLLVEERDHLGGTARWCDEPTTAADLDTIQAANNINCLTGTLAFGHYGDRVALQRGTDLVTVVARRVTLAPGRHDPWPLFANNDLPGVLSLHGAWRLAGEHGVTPGQRVAVHGKPPAGFAAALQRVGATIVAAGEVTAAHGGTTVAGATIGDERIDCDCIVATGTGQPRIELLQQAGANLRFDDAAGGLSPVLTSTGRTSVKGLYAAFSDAGAI